MAISWNIFRSYSIERDEDGDLIINYIDNREQNITYRTASTLGQLFCKFDIYLPVYDWIDPPETGVLDLIEPKVMVDVCSKILSLLNSEYNPFVGDGEYLFSDSELICDVVVSSGSIGSVAPSVRDGIIVKIKEFSKLFEQGYYITVDSD